MAVVPFQTVLFIGVSHLKYSIILKLHTVYTGYVVWNWDTVLIVPPIVIFAGIGLVMLHAEMLYWLILFWEFVSRTLLILQRIGGRRPVCSSLR